MQTDGPTEAVIQLRLLYFPGWAVSIDDKVVETKVTESGRLQFRVPAGLHRVAVQFRRTTVRFIAELISSVAFLGLLFVLWRKSFGGIQSQ